MRVCERDVVAAEFVTFDDHEDVVLTDFCVNAIVLELVLICLSLTRTGVTVRESVARLESTFSVTVAAVAPLQSGNDGGGAASTSISTV